VKTTTFPFSFTPSTAAIAAASSAFCLTRVGKVTLSVLPLSPSNSLTPSSSTITAKNCAFSSASADLAATKAPR